MVYRLRKKEFTSFDIAAVIKELKALIPNSRVNNIYQFGEKTLIFKLHKIDMPPIRLVVEAARRLHTTVYAEESPEEPPPFCMLIRRYLRDSWLDAVEQEEFERIVTLTFRTKTGPLKLVVELFGEGNFILTNEAGVIIQALEFKRMRDRNVMRNEILILPPAIGRNPFKVGLPELVEGIKNAGDAEVVRALARFLGIGGVYAEELLLRANLEKSRACSSLSDLEIKTIFNELQSLLKPLSDGALEPNLITDEGGGYLDVVPLMLKRYEDCKTQTFTSFNAALDEFYLRVIAAERAAGGFEVEKLKIEGQRLRRVIADQEHLISEDDKKVQHDKKAGDIIYVHLNELQSFQDSILQANVSGKNWRDIISEIDVAKRNGKTPETYVESFDGKNLALNVCIDELHFSLNLRRSLYENANEYYERGKKAKQKAAAAILALNESKKKLSDIEIQLKQAEELKNLKPAQIIEALTKRKIETKEWFKKFRYFISSDGFLVVAGKDTVSNEVLIKKHTTQEDVVFHAEITGAPFVVVKTEGKFVSEQVLSEAAEFAASFSRAWRENAGSADVYWVKVDQLSKSGPSGESVPHGAFFVVGKRNWFRNTALRVAAGIIVGEEIEFVGGPVEAVKAKTKVFVVILPGDHTGKELLQHILRALMFKLSKEQREKAGKTSIEQIRDFVPYTKGAISQKPA
jgi:predicted ribosome quality control (RQC) complex YloA/Tae2 family protein